MAADGNAVCEVADLTPIRDWTKKTGDPALTAELGPFTKSPLRLSASTGRIMVTVKQGKVTETFAFAAFMV